MLRVVIWVLLVANAAYFAWTQGYLAPLGLAPVEQSEPQRLQSQVRPEALRLLNAPKGGAPTEPAPTPAPPPPAAPDPVASGGTSTTEATATAAEPAVTATPTAAATAPTPPTACWAAYGFTEAQADGLRAALGASGLPRGSWQLAEVQLGGRWVVYMGRYNAEQLERKKTELRDLGIAFREVSGPLSPGLALGTYPSEALAEQGLQDVAKKGVRTARVAQERETTSAWNLRLPEITEAQRKTVAGLGVPLAGKRLQSCD